MSTLSPQAAQIRTTTGTALTLVTQLPALNSVPRQYVAEMLVVRLFTLFEAVIEDSACRLVCGADYCDGTSSSLQRPRPTQGLQRARDAMRHFGRADPHNRLRWNKAGEIRKNLEFLFPTHEHFIDTIDGHGQFISELRKVRNHIAHNNHGTRRRFNEVVSNYYGASINGMTPGRMLLSNRFSPIVVEQFCRKTQIVLLAAIKG